MVLGSKIGEKMEGGKTEEERCSPTLNYNIYFEIMTSNIFEILSSIFTR